MDLIITLSRCTDFSTSMDIMDKTDNSKSQNLNAVLHVHSLTDLLNHTTLTIQTNQSLL